MEDCWSIVLSLPAAFHVFTSLNGMEGQEAQCNNKSMR
jgi:hypothetical protein